MISLHHLVLYSVYISLSIAQLLQSNASPTTNISNQLNPGNVPAKTRPGQIGTNKCGKTNSQYSMCQNAYLNAIDDFCLFAPAKPGPNSLIGTTERDEISWCMKTGMGTRLIPDGTITGAHFVKTPDFVQVTGAGNLTKINIPAGDKGGELDPYGTDGYGNPVGGLVFSAAFGHLEHVTQWTIFVSDTTFCFRVCKGPHAAQYCQHIYDIMGCFWNMPSNYGPGFDTCKADSGEPMGVYGTSTFYQGEAVTPLAHPPPMSSSCTTTSSIGNGYTIPTSSSSSSVVLTGLPSKATVLPSLNTPTRQVTFPTSFPNSAPYAARTSMFRVDAFLMYFLVLGITAAIQLF